MKLTMNPIAELDGDEMTRVLWRQIKDELLLPFVDLNTEYYDLSLPRRDETEDRVTLEAAEAIRRLHVGVTKIGSVQGYVIQDGERIPIPGRLYYRGYPIEDILEAHRQKGTFGYEEVAYLLLMGSLPTQEQLSHFHDLLATYQTLPNGFFEDMILKAPSPDVMNKLSRSVLAMYSYDENPDDTSMENRPGCAWPGGRRGP